MNHFLSPFFSALLCLGILSHAVTTVETENELKDLFENRNNVDETIELTADLVFSQDAFPLGLSQEGCTLFTGVLHGNGHSIKCHETASSGQKQKAGCFAA